MLDIFVMKRQYSRIIRLICFTFTKYVLSMLQTYFQNVNTLYQVNIRWEYIDKISKLRQYTISDIVPILFCNPVCEALDNFRNDINLLHILE